MKRLRERVRRLVTRVERMPAFVLAQRIGKRMERHSLPDLAAGISYYAALSLFPLLLGAIALLGQFLPSASVQADVFAFVDNYLPGAQSLVERNITGIIAARGALGIVSIVGLLWTGSAIFAAMTRALNRIWDVRTRRHFVLRKARDLLLALSLGLVFFLSMGVSAVASILPSAGFAGGTLVMFSRLVGLALIFVVTLLLFKYLPNRRTPWHRIWPGALLGAVLFEAARTGFTFYLERFSSFDLVYGSVATIIVLLIWVYVSTFAMLVAAEITAELGREAGQPAHQTPAREAKEGGQADL